MRLVCSFSLLICNQSWPLLSGRNGSSFGWRWTYPLQRAHPMSICWKEQDVVDLDDKYGFFMNLMDLIWVWSYPIFRFLPVCLGIPIFFYVYPCSISCSVFSLLESKMFGIPGTGWEVYLTTDVGQYSYSLTALFDMGSLRHSQSSIINWF